MLRGNYDWHADGTYSPLQAKGAVYSAQVVPSVGGQTGWTDMRASYDALNDSVRERIETLSAHHSIHYAQARRGFSHDDRNYAVGEALETLRPLVKVHPETGRKSLLIGRHAHAIPGLSEADSEAFLDEITAFACRPPRTYFQDWRPGDLVVWDNRCLMHCVKPWDMAEPRIMWHTGLSGDPASEGVRV
jgi:alpha-ketoglutarate-dependent taurine dioxygenase